MSGGGLLFLATMGGKLTRPLCDDTREWTFSARARDQRHIFASETNATPSLSNDLTLAGFVCLSDRQNSVIGTPFSSMAYLCLVSLSVACFPSHFIFLQSPHEPIQKQGEHYANIYNEWKPSEWPLSVSCFLHWFREKGTRGCRDNHSENVLYGQSNALHTVRNTQRNPSLNQLVCQLIFRKKMRKSCSEGELINSQCSLSEGAGWGAEWGSEAALIVFTYLLLVSSLACCAGGHTQHWIPNDFLFSASGETPPLPRPPSFVMNVIALSTPK